ncbi:TerB N-terminal domain-containing protein [Janthinobacterium sp. Mn2066]|uniref:TerB N-terminal domain-containing protein n=1 Tax=Janthinobacterium sp. Mn2066 TaxID=3395264 RepID=UPI003BC598D0
MNADDDSKLLISDGPDKAGEAPADYLIPPPPSSPTMARWYPRNESVHIAGLSIAAGMLYVGERLPGKYGTPDACLIDPRKTVEWKADYTQDHFHTDWPNYSDASPRARGAYLRWLADGRSSPEAHISNIWLFFYGLERRVVIDAVADHSIAAEFGQIAKELHRLLKHYGAGSSDFTRQCYALLNFLDFSPAPARLYERAIPEFPPEAGFALYLRIAIGQAIADNRPIPAELALAWARCDPGVKLGAAALRYPDVFRPLFLAQYRHVFGDGLTITAGRRRLGYTYFPASHALRDEAGISLDIGDIPDVTVLSEPAMALQKIIDACTPELDAHHRLQHDVLSGALAGTTVALYASPPDTDDESSAPSCDTASFSLELLIVLAQAEGVWRDDKLALLDRHIGSWGQLTPARQQRLKARSRLLSCEPVPMASLQPRIAALDQAGRDGVASNLVAMAQAGASLMPEEVSILARLFALLDCDMAQLEQQVHAMFGAPVIEPMDRPASSGIKLDLARIAELQQDSARVAALLGDIFSDEAAHPAPAVSTPVVEESALPGLDAAHSQFVRKLLARVTWSRAELVAMAGQLDIMLDGALERINEASLDAFDMPCTEGDDPIEINPEIHERISA